MRSKNTTLNTTRTSIFLILMFFQLIKDVFVGPLVDSDFPSKTIKAEISNLNLIYSPQSELYLRDATVLKSVETIAMDLLDIFEDDMLVKQGIPSFLGGEPKINHDYPQLCPSKLQSEKSITSIRNILSFLSNFDIKNVIYYYRGLKPIGTSAQSVRCTCDDCIRTIEERFGPSLEKLFKKALAGTSPLSYEELNITDDSLSQIELINIRKEIDQIDEEKKRVYSVLRDEYFTFQGLLIKEAHRTIIQSIIDITGASVKIVLPIVEGDFWVDDDSFQSYAEILGFSKDMVEELGVKVVFARSVDRGGDLIEEFPMESRGIYIYSDDTDDKLNQRLISYNPQSGEVFILSEDEESLLKVLRTLSLWGEIDG